MPDESTTPDLLAIIERAAGATNRRDYVGALAPFAPDATWDMSPVGIGCFKGHEAIRGFFEDWQAAYEDYEVEREELPHLGDGVTLGLLSQRGRPAGGTGFVDLRQGFVILADGPLIESVTIYPDIDEARAAARRLAKERG